MKGHDPNRNVLWARAIMEELSRSGVREVCASPGSRSTPLTLAAAAHPELRLTMHVDERCASFYALGTALVTGSPAALVCTSGTAGAHYLPAVIEARYARVPLVVLTADRPAELMSSGAGQTIDQGRLFGEHVREFVHADLPVPEALALRHLRASVDRLVATARGDVGGAAGAVHMNVPFREPLAPEHVEGDVSEHFYEEHPLAAYGRDEEPLIAHARAVRAPHPDVVAAFARALDASERPVISVGPLAAHEEDLEGILELGAKAGIPILADPASQLRTRGARGARVLVRYDAFLRSGPWREANGPDLVLRFGAMPTSKVHRFWREAHPGARELLVDADGRLHDQVQHAEAVLPASPGAAARALLERVEVDHSGSAWNEALLGAEAAAAAILERACETDVAWEGAIARELRRALRADDTLMLASSMPIRDQDAFGGLSDVGARVVSNRGANGIDGLTSTCLGAASQNPGAHTWAVIGDVAFLHDAGGLFGARHAGATVDATIVVPNNSGGGIFHYLPIANHDEVDFERLFATAHDAQIAQIASAYGVAHARVESMSALRALLTERPSGVRVIEVIVDREDNVARHRSAWAEVMDAQEAGS